MKGSFQATVALARVGAILVKVGVDVMAAIPGGISPDEAEAIARKSLDGEDIRVMVKGEDIIDDQAQAALATFLAKVQPTNRASVPDWAKAPPPPAARFSAKVQ